MISKGSNNSSGGGGYNSNKYNRNNNNNNNSYNNKNYDNERMSKMNLLKCVEFCMDEISCRRELLLQYFGETFNRENCNKTCDNCKLVQFAKRIDCTLHAKLIIKIVQELTKTSNGRRSSLYPPLTMLKLVKLYCRSKGKDLVKYGTVVDDIATEYCNNMSSNTYDSSGNNIKLNVPANLDKNVTERLIVKLITMEYLDEEVVETG